MPSKEQYHPLNGKEIRQILIKDITEKINAIPRMKEGHAYHEANLAYSFTMTAFPADCPVPSVDYEVATRNQGFNLNEEYIDNKAKATALEDKKKALLAQITEIDKLLDKIKLTVEEEVVIQAGKVPDNVRVAYDMPLPRVVTEGTMDGGIKMVDKMIDYNKL